MSQIPALPLVEFSSSHGIVLCQLDAEIQMHYLQALQASMRGPAPFKVLSFVPVELFATSIRRGARERAFGGLKMRMS